MSRLTSSFICQLISIIITTLIIRHSFNLSLQAENLPFQQILPTLIYLLPWTTFTITGPGRQTYRASRVISRAPSVSRATRLKLSICLFIFIFFYRGISSEPLNLSQQKFAR